MRADTHDGLEQMLHVRGLIHCCSSHVRRSWNSVLQRTAGPYIMAHFGSAVISDLSPECAPKRTSANHSEFMGSRPRRDAGDQVAVLRSGRGRVFLSAAEGANAHCREWHELSLRESPASAAS